MPSGGCTVARQSAAPPSRAQACAVELRMPSQVRAAFMRLTNACALRPGTRAPGLAAWSPPRRSAARSPCCRSSPLRSHFQEPPLQQFGVEPSSLCPAMLPQYGDIHRGEASCAPSGAAHSANAPTSGLTPREHSPCPAQTLTFSADCRLSPRWFSHELGPISSALLLPRVVRAAELVFSAVRKPATSAFTRGEGPSAQERE